MNSSRLLAIAMCSSLYGVTCAVASNEMSPSHTVLTQSLAAMHNTNKTNMSRMQVVKSYPNTSKGGPSKQSRFTFDPQLSSNTTYTYIVMLNELAVGQAPNASAEIAWKKRKANTANRHASRRADNEAFADFSASANQTSATSGAINQQINIIARQQQDFLAQSSALGINIKPLARYKYGINGMAIRVSQSQAQQLSELPQVKSIQKEQTRKLNTDRGPVLIGAPKVWDGTAFSGVTQTSGETVVIGIIDSGINTDHPSFAEVSGDGYVHTNPRGDGNFLGDCAGNFAQLCNNKLIGVYSYTDITDDYSDTSVFPPNLPRNGEDYGGHGSHVASIAAGNILLNVDEVFPSEGQQRSSGTPTGFAFERISGVAPRANIISYQVCYGGTEEREDTYADCKDSAILKAIDDAIKDNVDIINYSISGGDNPWTDPTEQAFLSARNAGIFVAVSAGNEGPETSTSEKTAPWYTSVAASEHGRENVFSKQLNDFSGGASTLNAMLGQSNTGSLTASIVYAGDFANSNDPTGDSAQCLEPFPEGTFNGQIVVCDRGDIARIQKAVNVRDGGAGGYVLVNVDGSETFLANDQYVIPGIHLDALNGNALKLWLRSGQNHQASITSGVPSQVIDASRVDVVADYSSRGPNTGLSTLVPTMTAPGSNIFAAYADEQLGHDGHQPAASDFTTLDGTSMSSPHVAGAAALIKAANPAWGPDEIRSALALTATIAMKKDNDDFSGFVDADFFDMGSGRIQVDKAIASPLVMLETDINYANADPAQLGDPRSLNIPSITDNQCAGICTWSRTFTATTDASFTYEAISISPGLSVEASPARFTLLEGQSQDVEFTINSVESSKIDYSFALAKFTSPGLPDTALPISILSTIGNFPSVVDISARRTKDSILVKDINAVGINEFALTPYQMVKATVLKVAIGGDSNNGNYLDNANDGVNITTITVAPDAKRLIAKVKQTSSLDIDLFVLFDANNDGIPSLSEEVAVSRESLTLDEIQINYPQAGTYFIAVQNFSPSSNSSDDVDIRYAVVTGEAANDSLSADAPNDLTSSDMFDMRVVYDLSQSESESQSQNDDDYYGAIGMGSVAGSENIGLLNIDIERVQNDVFIDGDATRVNPGESAPLAVKVMGNPSNEARSYRITLPLPVGTRFSNFSSANNGQIINNEIVWIVDKPAGSALETSLAFAIEALQGVPAGPLNVSVKSELLSLPFAGVETSKEFTRIQIEGSPTISFDGNTSANLTVTETKSLTIPLLITEPNNDNVTVDFLQTTGPTANIIQTQGLYRLQAPLVETDTLLSYTATATDTNGNSNTGLITINVLNNGTPVITNIDAPASADGGSVISISVDANDPENDSLELQINGRSFTGLSTTVTTPSSGASVRYVISASDGITQAEQTIIVNLRQVENANDSGGGSLTWYVLCLLPFAVIRKRYNASKG